jgi:hypothetical protein
MAGKEKMNRAEYRRKFGCWAEPTKAEQERAMEIGSRMAQLLDTLGASERFVLFDLISQEILERAHREVASNQRKSKAARAGGK